MSVLLFIVYLVIAFGIYKWLQPSQFASALSNIYLFGICLLWPIWAVLIIILDTINHFRSVGDDTRAFEDIKPADPGPRKKEK